MHQNSAARQDQMTPNEKLTLAYMVNELKPGHDAHFREFCLGDGPERHLVAHCQMAFDSGEPVYAVFTVGRFSDRIFLTITDGDPIQLASVLAGVERYDASQRPVGYGQTMRMENQYLSENSRPALVFLRPYVLPFLDNFEDCADVGGRHLEFLLVVFLNEGEYSHKLSGGLGALYDKFAEENKDLIAIAG